MAYDFPFTLQLMRHEQAEDSADSDRARNLTEKGRLQSRTAAAFCKQANRLPEVVLTSPYNVWQNDVLFSDGYVAYAGGSLY